MGTALTERPCHVSQGFITRTALTSGAALSRQPWSHHAHCSHQRRGLVTSAKVSSRALPSPSGLVTSAKVSSRALPSPSGLVTSAKVSSRALPSPSGLVTSVKVSSRPLPSLAARPCHVSQGLITRTALSGLVTSAKVSSRALPSPAARPCHVSQGLITRTALTSGATLSRQPRSHHAHCPTGRAGFGDDGGKEAEGLRKSVRGLGHRDTSMRVLTNTYT